MTDYANAHGPWCDEDDPSEACAACQAVEGFTAPDLMERGHEAGFAQRYADNLSAAATTYADVLAALRGVGVAAKMATTGGGCLAIEWATPDGGYMLLTDEEDVLSYERAESDGWALGQYDEEGDSIGEVLTTSTKTAATALALVTEQAAR